LEFDILQCSITPPLQQTAAKGKAYLNPLRGSAKPDPLGPDSLLLLCQALDLSPIVCSYYVAEILAVGRRNTGEPEAHPTWRPVFFGAKGI
jgi:hypothetical protein